MKQNCFNCRIEFNCTDLFFVPLCSKCEKWRDMITKEVFRQVGREI